MNSLAIPCFFYEKFEAFAPVMHSVERAAKPDSDTC